MSETTFIYDSEKDEVTDHNAKVLLKHLERLMLSNGQLHEKVDELNTKVNTLTTELDSMKDDLSYVRQKATYM
ncbi:MAG: hypothetical protein IBX57_01130 [Gammaproteobacteria bacterium]|nr:hypothetical protein [Gammaproteobacteria bacterium]